MSELEPIDPPALDLDGIERDLADVEVALARLDTGDYWRDEVTGAPLDDALLALHPTARRGPVSVPATGADSGPTSGQ